MRASRREFVVGAGAAAFAYDVGCTATVGALTPEAFGAKGDGRTNDTDAFTALSAHVNARGGGTIALRPVTYIVGKQTRDESAFRRLAYAPATILHFLNCKDDVIVRGNGARLRCASGLRFGTFDPRTGKPRGRDMPFDRRDSSLPYRAMIQVEHCSGAIEISDVELDGNLGNLQVGGRSRKDGWQFPATGIKLVENTGPERLSRIYTHHHALDGLTLYGPVDRMASTFVTDVRSEYNGRQGCSLTGGRNYTFERCKFRHTGKAGIRSRPSAGVDIEAGRHSIRNVSFSDCEFSNNNGVGLIADSGDTQGVTVDGCTFIGTTHRSVWPKKPGFRFTNCLFVGSLVNPYGDPDPAKAAQFHDCRFSDDPSLSLTRQVFGGRARRQFIAELPKNQNVLFNRCNFELVDRLLLPTSTSAVIYVDCQMSQRAAGRSDPKGTYYGTNRLDGNIDLTGSIIRGDVILNGLRVARNA